MAIIALKAWYIEQYQPLEQIVKNPCDLRLSRNSLLKTGMRADFLDERVEIQSKDWFAAYIEGNVVEFYIEGSGYYVISNIDLLSQEIYFTKQISLAGLEPTVYYSPQSGNLGEDLVLKELKEAISSLNSRSRIPLSLEVSPRPQDTPLRVSSSQFRKIRKSLLYIADSSPLTAIERAGQNYLLLDSNVCVEIGYALESKDMGQILLLRQDSSDLSGQLPFDVSGYKELIFKTNKDLGTNLPKLMKTLLRRFSLFA